MDTSSGARILAWLDVLFPSTSKRCLILKETCQWKNAFIHKVTVTCRMYKLCTFTHTHTVILWMQELFLTVGTCMCRQFTRIIHVHVLDYHQKGFFLGGGVFLSGVVTSNHVHVPLSHLTITLHGQIMHEQYST